MYCKGRGADWSRQFRVGPPDIAQAYIHEPCKYCEGSGRLLKVTNYKPYNESSTE